MQTLNTGESWDMDINCDIPSNYWIKNSDVDAELSGTINVIRERGNPRFVGDMTILRGKGFLFDKTFLIDAGSTVTFEDIEYLNPRLNITAHTRIPGQRRETDSVREDIDLCVHVTGTLEAPQIDPCEGSPFSQGDILPLIIANYYSSDTAQASGQFGRRVTDLLTSRVSQIGAKQLAKIGVETFEIDPTYGGELDPLKSRLTVGFSPVQNLYVKSAFLGERAPELGFEYRFNRSFYLQGRRDENELYQLNLQLHWEL
jgi:autotransporter translocation and assembly factor TamB